jgi:hypothetical protein
LTKGLTRANRSALERVRTGARRERARDLDRIERVVSAAGLEVDPEELLAGVRCASVTMNFEPWRLLADGRPVAEALHGEGVYRNQFETRISSGGLTAYPGGDRDRWERALFGGAYQAPGVREDERPKYGGLNLMNNLNGACAGFGSCHVRLRPEALDRTTFVFGDSESEPTDIAPIDAFEPVMAPLLESVSQRGSALGRVDVDVRAFVEGLARGDAGRKAALFAPAMTHDLTDYIEAQVHGVVELGRDAEALVIDPAFASTHTGELLLAAGERHGVAVEWNPGSSLALDRVPEDAPGDVFAWQAFCADGRARRLAERVVARHGAGGRFDAASIGVAAVSVVREPELWLDWGRPAEALQDLKYLWRLVVVYGDETAS